MSQLLTPPEALMTIAAWEQLRLKPYTCASGKRTIGWGHVILPGEDLEREITRAEAVKLFVKDVDKTEEQLIHHDFAYAIAQFRVNQRRESLMLGALVSFVFNIGMTKLLTAGPNGSHSGVARMIKEMRPSDVPTELRRWVHGTNPATGKKEKLAGLVARREDEVALWEGRL